MAFRGLPTAVDKALEQDGFVLLPTIFSPQVMRDLGESLDHRLNEESSDSASLKRGGRIYGARNVLTLYPPTRELWRVAPLVELLKQTLSGGFGLVRGLYFDKPPDGNWSLPWHRDRTIAVREHRDGSQQFTKPTRKSGVPHVEAPQALLEKMLTLRIHLDDADEENGALRVIAASHRAEDDAAAISGGAEVLITAAAGDVLAMRPLLIHASGASRSADRRRRILHLEFSGVRELLEGFCWHEWHS